MCTKNIIIVSVLEWCNEFPQCNELSRPFLKMCEKFVDGDVGIFWRADSIELNIWLHFIQAVPKQVFHFQIIVQYLNVGKSIPINASL